MISDDPDEDADNLDDDPALEALFGDEPAAPDETCKTLEASEWPSRPARDIGLHVDTETLTWFQTNHVDWRRQMRSVLRGWMIANTAQQPTLLRAEPEGDQPPAP